MKVDRESHDYCELWFYLRRAYGCSGGLLHQGLEAITADTVRTHHSNIAAPVLHQGVAKMVAQPGKTQASQRCLHAHGKSQQKDGENSLLGSVSSASSANHSNWFVRGFHSKGAKAEHHGK